jgi:kynurenine formamidase
MPGDPDRSYTSTILAHNALEKRWTGRGHNDLSSFEERAEHGYHVGTHLDGLGHAGIGERFYNGTPHDDMFGIRGLRKLGAENIPPLLTRGVLIDLARATGEDHLPRGFVVEPSHLEQALSASSHELEPGDAMLIHTGWGQLWETNPTMYSDGEPGIGEDAALWLAERRPCLVGSDNWAVEVVPSPDPTRPFIAHQHLITVHGIYMLENLDLTELASSGRPVFMLVVSPVVARGATGALVRPVAVL